MSGNGETAGSPNARQALLTAVDEHAGDAGAPVGDVIEAALEDVNGGLGRVCSALQQLHADGEVYQPNPTTVRRVATDGGNETGSPESRLEGVRKQLRLVLDDDSFERAQHSIRRANLRSLPFHHHALYALIHGAGEIPASELHARYEELSERVS